MALEAESIRKSKACQLGTSWAQEGATHTQTMLGCEFKAGWASSDNDDDGAFGELWPPGRRLNRFSPKVKLSCPQLVTPTSSVGLRPLGLLLIVGFEGTLAQAGLVAAPVEVALCYLSCMWQRENQRARIA